MTRIKSNELKGIVNKLDKMQNASPLELLISEMEKSLITQKERVNQSIDAFILAYNNENIDVLDLKERLETVSEINDKATAEEKEINKNVISLDRIQLMNDIKKSPLAKVVYELQSTLITANFLKYGLISESTTDIKLNKDFILPSIEEFKSFLDDFMKPFIDKYSNNDTVIKLLEGFKSAIIDIYKSKSITKNKNYDELLNRKPINIGKTYALSDDKITKELIKADLKKDATITDNETNSVSLILPTKLKNNTNSSITTIVTLSKELAEIVQTPVSSFDVSIMGAIANAFYYTKPIDGKIYLDIKDVLAIKGGEDTKEGARNYSEKQERQILNAIHRLKLTEIKFDLSKATSMNKEVLKKICEKYHVKPNESFGDYAINATSGYFKKGKGYETKGFVINDIPILIQMAQALGQIILVNTCWLNYPYRTEEKDSIRDYLLCEIYKMYGNTETKTFKRSNRILFESFYENGRLIPPNEKAQASTAQDIKTKIRKIEKIDRDNVCKILDFFAKPKDEGFRLIKGYKLVKESGKITGIDIILNEDYRSRIIKNNSLMTNK